MTTGHDLSQKILSMTMRDILDENRDLRRLNRKILLAAENIIARWVHPSMLRSAKSEIQNVFLEELTREGQERGEYGMGP